MKRLRALLRRLTGIFPSQQREQDLAAEIDSHIQMHIDDSVLAGKTREEARREAILTLGGVELTKQAYRDRSTIPFLESLFQDFSFGARQLRRNPGFAVTVILMLALGMAASVAIFAFVDAALIQPLPYPEPSRLVDVAENNTLVPRANISYPDYLDWKKFNTVFSSLDVYRGTSYILSMPAGAQLVTGARVSDGFFHTLGIVPILGRDFYVGEDQPSAPRTVILSYATWRDRFGSRKDILGQTVVLSGLPATVVGVLPLNFRFALSGPPEFWSPLRASNGELNRGSHNWYGVGRLKEGVTVAAALANMTQIAQQLERQYPSSNRGQGASVIMLSEAIVGPVRPILLTLLSGAGLLLLIACVNVASLLLIRSAGRRRETAVRAALGASRSRLIRQFVTEGLLLVTIGTVFGILLAAGAMKVLLHLLSRNMLLRMPYLEGLRFNLHVMAFAAVVALLAAVVFSATPLLGLFTADMRDGLTEGSRVSTGVLWRRLGSNLVVAELAIAMVLLVSAGLLGKSLYRLLRVDLGFQPDHLATLQIAVPFLNYTKPEQATGLTRRIITRVSVLPGVRSAAVTSILPVRALGNGSTIWIRFPGRPYDGKHIEVNSRDVSAEYFVTLQAKLLRGRYFTDEEDLSKPNVAVISESFAKLYFPGEDPVGKFYGDPAFSPGSMRQIIGVVADIKESSLDSETWPTEYLPYNQGPDYSYSLIVRSSQSEQTLLPSLSAAVHGVDPAIGITGETTMSRLIDDSPTASLHRSSAWLVGGFATFALLLSVIGLYGVITYSVSQRTREIGVRMALGAHRGMVYGLILKEAGSLTACGIVAGIICAIGTASVMRSLLFGTQAWDISTLIAITVTLGTAAMFASYIPARRAASINPVEALRAE